MVFSIIGSDNLCGHNSMESKTVPFGQLYHPDQIESDIILNRIYSNGYFTNHGPLAIEFEEALEKKLAVNNVIATTNNTIALLIALVGLELKGAVIVPAFCPDSVTAAVLWAGLKPVFCDVSLSSHQITPSILNDVAINNNAVAVIAVSLWGGLCDIDGIASVSNKLDLKVVHYAVDAFGVDETREVSLDLKNVVTVHSFDETKILSTGKGACVSTDDRDLAEAFRNIRSSYGAKKLVKVPVTINGRFSELQAGIGLWSLHNQEKFKKHNKEISEVYSESLSSIKGIKIFRSEKNIETNYQNIVLVVNPDLCVSSRDDIYKNLKQEKIEVLKGYSQNINLAKLYGMSDDLCSSRYLAENVLQLPVGKYVSVQTAKLISSHIVEASR